jgi:hypothetical protein
MSNKIAGSSKLAQIKKATSAEEGAQQDAARAA